MRSFADLTLKLFILNSSLGFKSVAPEICPLLAFTGLAFMVSLWSNASLPDQHEEKVLSNNLYSVGAVLKS